MSSDNLLIITPNLNGAGFCLYDTNFSDLSNQEKWFDASDARPQTITKLMAEKYERDRQGIYPSLIEAFSAANRYRRTWPVEYGISVEACKGTDLTFTFNGSSMSIEDLLKSAHAGAADPGAIESLIRQLLKTAFPAIYE